MGIKKYLGTFQGLQAEGRFLRICVAALLGIVAFLVVTLANRPTIVTIQPWTLSEDAQVTRDRASRSYIEAWGFALSQLLGNVTPSNVGFIGERLGPLLDPAIYHSVMDGLGENAHMLIDQRISIRFEPRRVVYEKSTGKVFVTGYSYAREGSSLDNEKRTERTYEFQIKIDHYAPLITSIDTYEGGARTRDVQAKRDAKINRQHAREVERACKEARFVDEKADTRTTTEADTKL